MHEPTEVVAPTALPMAQRAWTCPYCDVGLPALDRWSLEKSRVEHLRSAHPKKKHDGSSVAKARWVKWKQNPESEPTLTATVKKRRKFMYKKYSQSRNWEPFGHKLVTVEGADWNAWPVAGTKPGMTMLTCVHCRCICKGSYKER